MTKMALVISALWFSFAVLIVVELIGHLIGGTSDARSHSWRTVFAVIFLINTSGLFYRFSAWRWRVVVATAFAAMRDYFYLMAAEHMSWGIDQLLSAARLTIAVATVAIAVLWSRLVQQEQV